jgi:hypothetical protein
VEYLAHVGGFLFWRGDGAAVDAESGYQLLALSYQPGGVRRWLLA